MELSVSEIKSRLAKDAAAAQVVRRKLGLDGVKVTVPPHFDDPAYSRQVLGLGE